MTYGCHASLTRPLSLEHLIYKHHTLIVRHTYNLGVQQNVFSYLLNSNFECKKMNIAYAYDLEFHVESVCLKVN